MAKARLGLVNEHVFDYLLFTVIDVRTLGDAYNVEHSFH